MTPHDLDILNRCHDDAVKEMAAASAEIADSVCCDRWPTKLQIDRYRRAKIGVDATRRDLEYCLHLEIAELINP